MSNDLSPRHLNALGIVLRRNLSVIDRLRCERVSPRWNWAVWRFGWTEQRKLDHYTLFEGIPAEEFEVVHTRFMANGCENLLSLFERVEPYLLELDLISFQLNHREPSILKIAESLQFLPALKKLNIFRFNFWDFVHYLPSNLREFENTAYWCCRFNLRSLEILSERCPNLEEVPFNLVDGLDVNILNKFIGKFPRQKRLELRDRRDWTGSSERSDVLVSIGELTELEKLRIDDHSDGSNCWVSLEAIAEGCQRLRSFYFNTYRLTESDFFPLAKIQNLTELNVYDQSGKAFSDAVLKAIAERGKLKRLIVSGANQSTLTDDSIVYLVDRCKSLTSLCLNLYTEKITYRSLRAVVAEVRRRHGSPPRTLPTDPYDDYGIFYFVPCPGTGIDTDRARELIGDDNPWLIIDYDDRDWDVAGHYY